MTQSRRKRSSNTTLHRLTDVELVGRTHQGDHAAFDVLYQRYRHLALGAARREARSAADAEDLASAAMLAVFRAILNGGGPTDGCIGGYVLQAVRTAALDRTRRRTQQMEHLPGDLPEPADPTTDPWSRIDRCHPEVSGALGTLPPPWSRVLVAMHVEGRSPTELAPELGLEPNAVSALAYRARRGLRRALMAPTP